MPQQRRRQKQSAHNSKNAKGSLAIGNQNSYFVQMDQELETTASRASSAAAQTTTSATSWRGPSSPLLSPVIWCILITETGERFCFYGFRSCLVLYFTMALEMEEHQAIAWFAYTTAFAYLTPIGGALLADGHFGRYTAILIFGIIYVIGLIILTAAAMVKHHVSAERIWAMTGLFLICIGTGGVKPCVSAFGADQVGGVHVKPKQSTSQDPLVPQDIQHNNPHDELLMDHHADLDPREALGTTLEPLVGEDREEQVRAFFNYFYFCINVGAVTSVAVIPEIRNLFGFGAAFLVPTIFMVIAMALFLSMKNRYVHHVPGKDGTSLLTTFRMCGWLLYQKLWTALPGRIRSSCSWLQPAAAMPGIATVSSQQEKDVAAYITRNLTYVSSASKTFQEPNEQQYRRQLEEAAQALRVLPIMSLLPIFWCLYDQQGSVWTLQAARMNLGGFKPEQLSIFNPIEIMILIPLFEGYVYPWLLKHNCRFSPMWRMQWGMLLTAMAFFVSGLVESEIQIREKDDEQTQIHVLWQLPQITLLSIGEIFVSVTGLEFAYSESPESLRSFWMAVFLLTTAIGDLFSGILYSTVFSQMNRALVMYICAILMLLNLGLFVFVARTWERYDRKRSSSNLENFDSPDGKQGYMA